MTKIKRVLISVSDKTGLVEFVKGLLDFGVEILASGGTAKLLRENNVKVMEVSDYTGFPEMLDGRVKTLHPKIHGGLLALRDNPEHIKQIKEHGIGFIDMVVVNLYPFEKTVAKPDVKFEEAIENIDIGGPSMLRSAAKNHRSVAVVCNPARYKDILSEMKKNTGAIPEDMLKSLAVEVFERTSGYDTAIFNYLKKQVRCSVFGVRCEKVEFPEKLELQYEKVQDLRYGENPHQKAAFYGDKRISGACVSSAKQLHGKELSFNNIYDLDAALEIVKEFKEPACAVIKHTNPCGTALAKTLKEAFEDALSCDPVSAFGSIISLNRTVDVPTAKSILEAGFTECVIAPSYDAQALDVLKTKKNLRILEVGELKAASGEFDLKKVKGGLLAQDADTKEITADDLKVVTEKKPTEAQIDSMLFGWKVAKHVKSNAIVLCQGTKTVGVGAGQMSRVDSVFIACEKAGERSLKSTLASDAFFPKEDAVKLAAKKGIEAIIQPGGSIADEEVIKAADGAGIVMVFTGVRHFRH
ncbi:MAG: bifunctional phosphoribosylaminoimidazolecarboxamide formyltransferase/IMP cyclohydrolase [Candidatus Omnitrophota bacterium]